MKNSLDEHVKDTKKKDEEKLKIKEPLFVDDPTKKKGYRLTRKGKITIIQMVFMILAIILMLLFVWYESQMRLELYNHLNGVN